MLVFYAQQLVRKTFPIIGDAFKNMNDDLIDIKKLVAQIHIKELFKRDIEPKLRQIDH